MVTIFLTQLAKLAVAGLKVDVGFRLLGRIIRKLGRSLRPRLVRWLCLLRNVRGGGNGVVSGGVVSVSGGRR